MSKDDSLIVPDSKESSKSWFCVLNNPQKIFCDIDEPQEMVERAIEMWCENKPQRTCAVNYEIGDNGTPHMHMVLEDPQKTRFSALQKMFPGIHIEKTRGNKEQAENYIMKRGKFIEKEHTVVVPAVFRGQIKANQGKRNDLDVVQELIEQGMSLNDILDVSIHYLEKESTIRKAYFRYHLKHLPDRREINVVWHVGGAGTGKTNSYNELKKKYGENEVYMVSDYANPFDFYAGQKVLFLDEFRCGIRYGQLMQYLEGYKGVQLKCRYANVYALWNEVHFATVYPPEEVYKNSVQENQQIDTYGQLERRIKTIVYHWKDKNGYHDYTIPFEQYKDYVTLKQDAEGSKTDGFLPVPDGEPAFGDL